MFPRLLERALLSLFIASAAAVSLYAVVASIRLVLAPAVAALNALPH